ncbi:MAG: tyrosine-type recombinase/integrase [Bacteroidota bacterium]
MAYSLQNAAGSAPAHEQNLLDLYLLRFDRPATRRAYRIDVREFFGTDHVTLAAAQTVTFVQVNEHITDCEARGLKPATLNRRVSSLRGFFGWLVALGALERNPADKHVVRKVRRTNAADRPITVLAREQARRLLDAVDLTRRTGHRDLGIMLTMLHCVLRRSETAGMQFEHVRKVGQHWALDLPDTKGGAGQYVKLPDVVREQIETVREVYGYRGGPIWRSFSHNSFGKQLHPRSVYDLVRKHARAAGILETVGAHTLRHTGCTLAIENGATLMQVKTHARHKNIQTTTLYVHQRDRLSNSAADLIDI